MKRTMVFIDANNWYHNLKGWLKPSDIDIKKIVNFISTEKNLDIIEIRWYTSMPSREDNELIYKRQRSFLGHLEKQGIKIISRKLQRLSNKELARKRQNLIESWDLCDICKPLVAASFLDMRDTTQKEKGIDVRIAIDMVNYALSNKLECCILISGDADFVPALELVKSIGKEVLCAFIPRGYSNELRQKFSHLTIKRDSLTKCLKEYKK
ncbi:MAG: NYN domain-containing protein [Nanoarchaeota archaeon]|nr:NYN domain-containing protein [Nanoarchaeota archaeon]MBU1103968.1 NYN domain-containing protein [Nanoarchaeota archaeon]